MARRGALVLAARPDPMVPAPFVVRRARRETRDTTTLDLFPADGEAFAFRPGQFNMLYAYGIGEVPISISGDASQPLPLVHTVRAVGAVTRALRALRPGSMVGVRGPFGTAWPVEAAEGMDAVIVAGGIGLATLRPVLYHFLSFRDRYKRVALLYGARTPQDLLFPRELERWRGRLDVHVDVTVDAPVSGWRGDVGVVTTLIPRAPFDPADALVFVCGPEVMMRFTVLELRKRGVPPERIVLSLERNMKCAIAQCGHCQLGPYFVCREGPVFRYPDVERLMMLKEV